MQLNFDNLYSSSITGNIKEPNILPSAPDRCTFTSTQLEYGNDRAIVEFYTRTEFNEMFIDMLRCVEYGNAENLSFDTLPLFDFENYFNKLTELNPTLYKNYVGKIDDDVKDIINGKDAISKHLNSSNLIFEGHEIRSEEFTSFITDSIKSRAVKKITIQSSELKDTRNIIIYDVPGFDSPYKIHLEQTIERLRNADGIVLVTNVGDTPNLLGTQLHILLRESDYDGIKLNDKLLIFGNKIDKVNDKQAASINIKALTHDAVNRYRIVKQSRLFIGSAYAYLQKKGISQNGHDALSKLSELEQADNVDNIKDALEEYYKTERFRVLKTRINRNIEELKEIFYNIIKLSSDSNLENLDHVGISLALEIAREAREKIEDDLARLRDNLMAEIISKKRFTQKLKELVDKEFQPIDNQVIEDVRIITSKDGGVTIEPSRVNDRVRDKLHQEFKEKFNNIITSIADVEAKEIREKIIASFMKAFNVSEKNNPLYFKEIEKAVDELIDRFTADVSYEKKSFIHLIERFSSDIFDILILYRFGGQGRFNKFQNAEEDLLSLAMYDPKKISDNPYYMQPLVGIVLAHTMIQAHDPSKPSHSLLEEIKKKLLSVIKLPTRETDALSVLIEKVLQEKGINSPDVVDTVLKDNLNHLRNAIKMKNNDMVRKMIERAVKQYPERQYIEQSINPKAMAKEAFIQKLMMGVKESGTTEEILNEINKDIKYLKELLKTAVIKAISLEKPFATSMIYQINTLIERRNHRDFDEFVST